MPQYKYLNARTKEGRRTIKGILALKDALKEQIPERTLTKKLLLATWNIRDFDKATFGYRMEESMYYIAEILSHFDIIAVQEVYKDLTGIKRVIAILGDEWKYIFSDATEGRQGNGERMVFVYDSRKITFGGLAGELVIPTPRAKKGEEQEEQVWRTPLICGFQAGWAKFMLCSVHVLYGKGGANSKGRISEIRRIAQFLKKRTEDKTAWARKMILLGDFNIFDPEDQTFKELEKAGFTTPEQLKTVRTNVGRDKSFDQIVFREREHSLEMTGNAGTFDFYEHVFKLDEKSQRLYAPFMGKKYIVNSKGIMRTERQKRNYYKQWRTHQLSDHLPLWVEFTIDYGDEYLRRKLKGETNIQFRTAPKIEPEIEVEDDVETKTMDEKAVETPVTPVKKPTPKSETPAPTKLSVKGEKPLIKNPTSKSEKPTPPTPLKPPVKAVKKPIKRGFGSRVRNLFNKKIQRGKKKDKE